jgi:hypothetical protein
VSDDADLPPPAFYAADTNPTRGAWLDWWVLLHPPYTMWHLSYVAIGASIAPHFDGSKLAATLIAFLLAVGVGAHALDELQGRPLRTSISRNALIGGAVVSIGAAVAIGIIGITQIGPGLAVFIIVGVTLNVAYNLELFGGRLHNDVTFAAAWGVFPVLTGYYAQAETLRLPALAAAGAAYWLSAAQRSLSTPARTLRRRVSAVEGTVAYADGRKEPLSRPALLAPLEAALKAMSYGMVALAVALVLYRTASF